MLLLPYLDNSVYNSRACRRCAREKLERVTISRKLLQFCTLSVSMHSRYLARPQASPFHFFFSSAIVILLAASSASTTHGHRVTWNQHPISFLSTCSPSFSFTWSSSAPLHLPLLIVNASSICTWHCSPPHPYPSHPILFSIVAAVACPLGQHAVQQGGCEEPVVVSADASPLPPLPHAPFSCSALSAPLTFELSFPETIHPLFPSRNGVRTSSTVELCVTGRSAATPHVTTYLLPCVTTDLPPPPLTHSLTLNSLLPSHPPLRVCSPHTSNQVHRIVSQGLIPKTSTLSQGMHRASGAAAPPTQEEHASQLQQVDIVSQFDIAFEVEEGAVAGCARLLLLPPFHTTTSPIFDMDAQALGAPNYIHTFPFRLKMRVSIRLEPPLFSTEGNNVDQLLLHCSVAQLLFVAFFTLCFLFPCERYPAAIS